MKRIELGKNSYEKKMCIIIINIDLSVVLATDQRTQQS